MLVGEMRPEGLFRFVNFGHPPPLVFSNEFGKFMEIGQARMVQFPPLGLEIPEDHPDRNKYFSISLRKRQVKSPDVAGIPRMSAGDILFLFTDGGYNGTNDEEQAKPTDGVRK